LLSPAGKVSKVAGTGHTAWNYWRAHEIGKTASRDVTNYIRANPNINYRYLVKPSKTLEWVINLVTFRPEKSKQF
jgi:hypothetical protein